MDTLNALGLFGIVILTLAAAAVYLLAPLMLYGIYSRLGETNRLLRSLSPHSPQHQAPPKAAPPPPAKAGVEPPSFRCG